MARSGSRVSKAANVYTSGHGYSVAMQRTPEGTHKWRREHSWEDNSGWLPNSLERLSVKSGQSNSHCAALTLSQHRMACNQLCLRCPVVIRNSAEVESRNGMSCDCPRELPWARKTFDGTRNSHSKIFISTAPKICSRICGVWGSLKRSCTCRHRRLSHNLTLMDLRLFSVGHFLYCATRLPQRLRLSG